MSKGSDVVPPETTSLSSADPQKSRSVEEKPTPLRISRSKAKIAKETASSKLDTGINPGPVSGGGNEKCKNEANGTSAEHESENTAATSTSSEKDSILTARTHSDTGNSINPKSSVAHGISSSSATAVASEHTSVVNPPSTVAKTTAALEKPSSPANSDFDLTASSSEYSYSSGDESWGSSDLFGDYL